MSSQEREQNRSRGAQSHREERKIDRPDRSERRRRHRPSHLEPSVNMAELREIIAVIQENGFAEFELQRENFRIHVRRNLEVGVSPGASSTSASPMLSEPAPAPAQTTKASATTLKQTAPEHPGAQAETAASEDQGLHMITSPIVGTFYRSASPNADPFVKIGSSVEPEMVVCIIEAMKLMNEIQAETSGEVVKIYVENGQPVEYGQPLFGIRN